MAKKITEIKMNKNCGVEDLIHHLKSLGQEIKKPFLNLRKALLNEVVIPGFEPGTHGFSVRCSTN